jgi:uncharacterized FlgJ-related protein
MKVMKLSNLKNNRIVKFFTNIWNVITGLIAIVALMFMILIFSKLNKPTVKETNTPVVKTQRVYVKYTDHFSEKKLKAFLKASNVKFPHIVFAQARLESANFTSNLFLKHHNMFGMRIASSRPVSYNYVTSSNFAGYRTWKESVLDYIFYQCCFMRNINTEEEYYNTLSKKYCQENTYDTKIKELAKEYFRK